jgi:type VI protein secretion system component Hcp
VAGNFSYAQMYMRAVAPKQGTFQPAVSGPSSVGNEFIKVSAIDFGGKPIKVTKATDATSPEFVEAAAEKEVFSTVVLKFANTDKTGKIVIYMTMTLTGAVISDLKQSNSTDVISFDYTKMTTEQTPPASSGPTVITPATTIKPAATPLVKKG